MAERAAKISGIGAGGGLSYFRAKPETEHNDQKVLAATVGYSAENRASTARTN